MKSSGIGGQAVLEGVMMKNRDQYAVAVRMPDDKIKVEKRKCTDPASRPVFFRLPVIRGVVAFVDSLVTGIGTLTYSSDLLEEAENSSDEKSSELWNVLTVVLALVLAVGIFMVAPLFLSEIFRSKIESHTLLALIEGIIRLLLFIGYVALISQMKEIKRVFMYHGAEHKSINCVECGLPLTVENVKKQSKEHKRCGTSFLLYVMIISIFFFIIVHVENIWLRMIYRIVLVPVIAGVSYEFIRFAGNTDNPVINVLSRPGMWLQGMTTKEPDESMIEVAIASINAVFDWEKYQRENFKGSKAKRGSQQNSSGKGTGKKKSKEKKKSRSEVAADIARREAQYKERREKEEARREKDAEAERLLQEQLKAAKERKEKRMAKEKAMKEKEERLKESSVDEEHDEILDRLDRFFDGNVEQEEPADGVQLDNQDQDNTKPRDNKENQNNKENGDNKDNQKDEENQP